jgi:hypothetical protein
MGRDAEGHVGLFQSDPQTHRETAEQGRMVDDGAHPAAPHLLALVYRDE